jgi:hypothetical protein
MNQSVFRGAVANPTPERAVRFPTPRLGMARTKHGWQRMSGTDVDYGPLAGLIGTWTGASGTDISPEPDGTEVNPYTETITFEAGGDVTNAESQTLSVVPYTQVVRRKSDGEVFHHQVGYWVWDPATGVVAQSVSIPRATCCLAGGTAKALPEASGFVLAVAAKVGDPDWGIIQSPFMRDRAKTTAYEHGARVSGDTLHYTQTIHLDIYGRKFAHTDENTLTRVV